MKTDKEIAQDVSAAFEALNEALSAASDAGLKVDVDCVHLTDCDRPEGSPLPFYSAKVSRPILA